MPAATEKACSIHNTGPLSSLVDRASFRIVFAAATQVRRVNAKAVFVNDKPRNLRWIMMILCAAHIASERRAQRIQTGHAGSIAALVDRKVGIACVASFRIFSS